MKKSFFIGLRLFLFSLLLAAAPGERARAQAGGVVPCVKPFCVEFHEGQDVGNFSGYLPCQHPNPGVSLNIGSPGASGRPMIFICM